MFGRKGAVRRHDLMCHQNYRFECPYPDCRHPGFKCSKVNSVIRIVIVIKIERSTRWFWTFTQLTEMNSILQKLSTNNVIIILYSRLDQLIYVQCIRMFGRKCFIDLLLMKLTSNINYKNNFAWWIQCTDKKYYC